MKKGLIALGVVGIMALSMATGFAAGSSTQDADKDVAFERMYQTCRDYYNKYVNDGDNDTTNAGPGWCYGPRDNR